MDAEGKAFDFWASLYADDCGMVFESQEHTQLGARLLKGHLARFALEMHIVGWQMLTGRSRSNPRRRQSTSPPPLMLPFADDDIAPLRVDDHCGIVTFTQRFRYLGSISWMARSRTSLR